MLKRLRKLKTALWTMVISQFWSFWRKTDHIASEKVKDTMLDDGWWERVGFTIKIMESVISLLRFANTNQPVLARTFMRGEFHD